MNSTNFEAMPGRILLDTCIVNLILDYGEQIHESAAIAGNVPPRLRKDIESLREIFFTGQRAFWQLAVSPLTYQEVTATEDPSGAYYLKHWFFEIWDYWRSFLHSANDLPSLSDAEEIRLRLLSSGMLDVLPDASARVLLCDAIVYRCDVFCTRDWSTILRHRAALRELPIIIVTPSEWWAETRPWAPLWV
jgi:hypothetical protein